MMKAVWVLMVLTAFGCALAQKKEATLYPMGNSSQLRDLPICPKECHCKIWDQNPQRNFQKAICGRIPVSLHQNIKSLQVIGTHYDVTAEHIVKMGTGLYMLDLTDCDIIDIEEGAFNSLTDLISLKLSENTIRRIGNKLFASPNLQVLYLDGNGLEMIEDYAFAQLPKLQKLHLQNNALESMSFTLPSSLRDLDISHNHISSITTDFNKVNLRSLDVCGNLLNGFPPIMSSRTLEILCLEGKAAVLPQNTATKFPQLMEITLVASSHNVQAELDLTTQELSNLNKLISLCIVNCHLQNLSFLTGMRNLANLKLQNVTLASYEDINNELGSLQILSNLSIDNSICLVKPILNNSLLVSRLTRLRHLSLRYTELVTLTQQNIPENTALDISYNPLRCDCHLAWIWHKQLDTLSKFLLSKQQTLCATPDDVEGLALLESVNMTCSDQQTSGMLEQLSDYRMRTAGSMYLSSTSTQVPMTDEMTTSYTASDSTDDRTSTQVTTDEMTTSYNASHSTGNSHDNSTLYIVIGTILLILIVVGVIVGVTLYIRKKKRTCQISPDEGETPMEHQPKTTQMKKASSKDMLVKK